MSCTISNILVYKLKDALCRFLKNAHFILTFKQLIMLQTENMQSPLNYIARDPLHHTHGHLHFFHITRFTEQMVIFSVSYLFKKTFKNKSPWHIR